jgi:hypothetical protein
MVLYWDGVVPSGHNVSRLSRICDCREESSQALFQPMILSLVNSETR